VSRSARAIKADFKIAATGTPVENRLLDAWTLFDFCCHPILGTQAEFAALEATANGVERVREIAKIGKGSEAYLLRREKRDAAKDLPQKHFHEVLHTMTPMQAARENEIAILASQHDASPLKILPMLAALYQFPEMERWRNISPKEALEISPKLKATFEILQQVQSKGEKAIIFAIRTEVLHLLASTFQSLFGLKHCHIVNGESNAQKQSHNRIREFSQHEGFQILVLNTVAAGCGLNIVAANHVIHYGRWWNPAKEDQATDRAYRIGQTKAVHVHYPLLHRPDSLDSGFDIRLHGIAQRKRELQTDFLASSNNEISGHELLNSTIIPGAAQRGTK
jgi:SNF2 family DNA or RNA helicase